MRHRFLKGALALPALVLVLVATPKARAADPAPAPAPATTPADSLRKALGELRLGVGIVSDQIILFPLYAPGAPTAVPARAGVYGAGLVFTETEPKLGGQTVHVLNGGTGPALVVAGTVIEGGRRDRMVRYDRLVPAGEAIEIEVMPASMTRDTRAQGKDFRIADFLAPSYLRESGQFSPDTSVIPRFVSHFLDFRNPSDTRQSLIAVGESDALADSCLACQRSFAQWPLKAGAGAAVGAILVVRGRVQSMEVFATNEQLTDFVGPLLKSLAFPAAAIALRAKRLGIPMPWMDDPDGTLATSSASAAALLTSLGAATYTRRKTDPTFEGEAFVVHLAEGARGTAIVRTGRLVHAVVYPGDPFEESLYAKPLTPLDADDLSGATNGDEGRIELERRAASGARLTVAELRLLARMRERVPGVR